MKPLIIDSFAGGGGASQGIFAATGRHPDIAINHDTVAVSMHTANHPSTRHLCKSVYAVDIAEECAGQPVGLLWASPDCTHHSKARGGKPRSSGRRDLAHVVVEYAAAVKPQVIILENVEEFRQWGPLDWQGQPIADLAGTEFQRWVRALRKLGYRVEHRELRACDYGAPTIRKRLFVVARRDGLPIVWPKPTHGPDRAQPYRTAAECIDWTIPCPSIFERQRPLADATLRRIARGVVKYVLEAGVPFLMPLTHQGADRYTAMCDPLPTVTCAHRGEMAMAAPSLVECGYGERAGQAPRCQDIDAPLGTVVGSQKHALVAAFLATHYGGKVGRPLDAPAGTVTTVDHHSMVAAHLSHFYTSNTCGGGGGLAQPLQTVTAGGQHAALVAAFIQAYYGTGGQDQSCADPLHTVPTRDRFGLVTVTVAGRPYVVADIGMRMLSPRELFRAQGFPDNYVIDRGADGRPLTKTDQVRMCGNSVCPPLAEAMVRANCAALCDKANEHQARSASGGE
jgi:DNA (cytosine-5)-methyltransferase 1